MKIVATASHTDWTKLKERRNLLLNLTDRFFVPGFPATETDLQEVIAYKAALRTMFDGAVAETDDLFPAPPAIVVQHIGPLAGTGL
ncbi:MAG: hypothetical protein ACT6QM_06080 [Brevundimonas mediterranea]|uniref:hypothetical protein n=1 Tax=Brevundimonas mediterranea TaxID=74329 RepID=UPI004033DF3B